MTQDYKHPIAPPEEVVQQWLAEPDRCPKPPSLKEQALEELAWVDRNLKGANFFGSCHAVHIIRRALEQLPDPS